MDEAALVAAVELEAAHIRFRAATRPLQIPQLVQRTRTLLLVPPATPSGAIFLSPTSSTQKIAKFR